MENAALLKMEIKIMPTWQNVLIPCLPSSTWKKDLSLLLENDFSLRFLCSFNSLFGIEVKQPTAGTETKHTIGLFFVRLGG